MDEQATARETIRLLRGSILRFLQVFYVRNTTAMEEMVKRHCMRNCRATAAHTAEALAYLADSGLVVREPVKADGLDTEPQIFFKLSAVGYRVVTGVLNDESVLLS